MFSRAGNFYRSFYLNIENKSIMLKCWTFMNWRLVYFVVLCFTGLRLTWGLSIPAGWSSVSFPITQISSPSEVFGTGISNIEEIVGLEDRRFTYWNINSTGNSDTLTRLYPNRGYFIKSDSTFDLSQAATFSLANYPLTTGFQLIPLKSGETL